MKNQGLSENFIRKVPTLGSCPPPAPPVPTSMVEICIKTMIFHLSLRFWRFESNLLILRSLDIGRRRS